MDKKKLKEKVDKAMSCYKNISPEKKKQLKIGAAALCVGVVIGLLIRRR